MNKLKRILSICIIIYLCFIPISDVHAYHSSAPATNDYTTWKQTSSSWGEATPWKNASIPKFGDAGCWITSMAMLLRHYNVVTDSNVNSFNPLICNTKLMSYGIINSAGDFCNLGSLSKAYSGISYAGSCGYSFSKLKSLYDQGYACIVEEAGHYVAVRSVSSSSAIVMDPGYSRTSIVNPKGIQYYKVSSKSASSTTSNNPQGNIDEAIGGQETITVRGWAFDRDSLGSYLGIHIYIGGPAGSGKPGYPIVANTSRPDVNNAFPGVGNNHGFDTTIPCLGQLGSQRLYFYALNVGGGDNTFLGTRDVYISKKADECSSPVISTTDVSGGKTLTISGAAADTMNYTIQKDGANYLNGSAGGSFTTTLNAAGTYAVSAYSSRSGFANSGTATKTTTLTQVAAPKIAQSITDNNIVLNMATDTSGAAIYYTISGNTPTISSSKYNGAVSVTSDKTIKAIAVKNGCVNSEVSVTTVKLEEPSAPASFSLDCNEKIPVGENVSVKWDKNIMASRYTVSLFKGDKKIDSLETAGTQATFNLTESGSYQLKIYASNFVGNGTEAETVLNVEAMNPVKVKFVDWDGSIIKEQEVTYGKDAALPENPFRKGYTFASWENGDQITGVKSDLTVTAKYKINTYSIRFYDAAGTQVGSTQKVDYGNSAQSPEADLTDIPTGYVFAGWKVLESSNDSECNYKAVDSDMKLQAVYSWENDELPIYTEITNATRNTATGNYNVDVKLTNYPKDATTAILRVSLLTTDGKMVKSAKEEIEVGKDESINKTITLKYSGIATKATVVVLGLNGDSLTGSAHSKIVEKGITEQSDTTWTDWGEWSDTKVDASDSVEVESKTQYRYADKSTTTSSASSMNGWTLYNTTSNWSGYGNWSGWSPAAESGNDYKQVETRTEWRYYCFYCPVCGGREPLQGKSDCGKYSLSAANAVEGWFPTAYQNSNSATYSYAKYKRYTTSLGDGQRWNFSSGNLYATAVGTKDSDSAATVIRTAYRYRTRSLSTTYYYYKWEDWGNWSDTEYVSNTNRKVETKTLYRVRKKVPVYSELAGTEETGKTYEFAGKLSVDADLSGKIATIMVYKGKNTDPNEDQIQYVGQTTIGADNAYSFKVVPKAEPTELSGDYTVCLGIEGATGLINVDIIKAPKSTYTVKYVDDGKEISSQELDEGKNAVVPASPKKEGYTFVGWSENATNVQDNLVISAVYEPIQYVVAFVDTANDNVSFESYHYGDKITPPTDPEAEGKEFVCWDIIEAGNDTVTGNAIACAVYKDQKFKVEFVNEKEEVISTQNVIYGHAAQAPAALDVEGKEFLGWSTKSEWWNVKEDITVKPILAYLKTADTPTAYFVENENNIVVYMDTATAGADIYYTLDGSEPTTDSEKYDGFIIIDDYDIEFKDEEPLNKVFTANIKAFSTANQMNSSEIVPITYSKTVEIKAEKQIDVTLDVNGGDALEENKITVLEGCSYGDLPTPIRANYLFDGWYTEKEAGTKITEDTLVENTENHTLYAHWSNPDEVVKDISTSCEFSCADTIYNAQEQKPEVKVVDKETSKELVENTDYTITYLDNINAGSGKVVITGSGHYNGKKEITFTIEKAVQEITTAVLQETIAVGQNLTIIAEAKGQISYSSSNEEIVTIDKDGKVSAISQGEATITILAAETENYKSATKEVKLAVGEKAPESDSCVDGHDTELIGAKAADCIHDGYSGDTHCKKCDAILSYGSVIKAKGHVWDAGVVTKQPTTTTTGIRTYTCTVCKQTRTEVIGRLPIQKVSAIIVTGKKIIKVGKKIKLKATVIAGEGADTRIMWSSSNKRYASVSAQGVVKAKKAGKGKKVKITAIALDGSGKRTTVTMRIVK